MPSSCGAGEDSTVPWAARRSNQSILKEINPEYSLGGLMLKLKLQYFGHLIPRTDSLEKTLMLGKSEGKSRSRRQRMRWWDSINESMDVNLSKPWETVKDRGAWCTAAHGVAKSQTWLCNWTELVLFINHAKTNFQCSNLKTWGSIILILILLLSFVGSNLLGVPRRNSWGSFTWLWTLGGSDGKESACNVGRPRFNPWVRRICWRRE